VTLRRLSAVVAGVVVLAAGACSDAAGPTKEQYVAMADDVCQETGEALDELYMDHAVDELLAASGEENVYVDRPERWVRAKVVPEYEGLVNRLRGIPPPDGDAAYLSDLYGDLEVRVELLHNRPSDGRQVVEADPQVRDRFTSYGMEACPPPYDDTPDSADPAKVMEAAQERLEVEAAPPVEGTEGEGQ